MSDPLRLMKMERINIYLAEHIEESLTFVRGEKTYTLLGINLAGGTAYIEAGEGIGELDPALEDEEIETMYTEILQRMHGQRTN